jgi:hypothetical protein
MSSLIKRANIQLMFITNIKLKINKIILGNIIIVHRSINLKGKFVSI